MEVGGVRGLTYSRVKKTFGAVSNPTFPVVVLMLESSLSTNIPH
jgi:hypothetical protein